MSNIASFLEWIGLKEKLHNSWYVPITHREIKCVAVLSQAKVLSAKRLLEKYGELDKRDVRNIRESFFLLYLGKRFVPLFQAGSWDNPK